MDALSTVIKFFQDCGLFIYPSALIMALGVTIAVERFIFLSKARNQNRKVWAQVLPLLQKGQLRDVQSVANQSDAAVGKIVSYGLTRMQSPGRREDFDAAMEEGMMEIVPRLEKRTHYIATFANVITLVGLLGTIIGLIKGFTAVASVNPAEKAQMLSASISIAMNNTAFINLIVVLVPFLLSVSVFTHLAVIDLSLPAQSNEQVQKLDPNKPLKLEVIVRANYIEVNDKHGGALPGSPCPRRERDSVRPRRAGDGRRSRRASGARRSPGHDRLLPQHFRRRRAGHQAVAPT